MPLMHLQTFTATKRNYNWKSQSYIKGNFSVSLHSLIFWKCLCKCLKLILFFPLFLPFTRKDFGSSGSAGGFSQVSWDSRDGSTWCQPAVCGHSVPSGGLSYPHPHTQIMCFCIRRVADLSTEMGRQTIGCLPGWWLPLDVNNWIIVYHSQLTKRVFWKADVCKKCTGT